MTSYIKSISKRNEGDDKEKNLPIASLGGSMVSHGEDFDAYSEYGRCLTSKPSFFLHIWILDEPTLTCYLVFGRTEERAARVQENYIAQANASWLESLERSMTQMKDYQVNYPCANVSYSERQYLTANLECPQEA